MKPLRHYFNLLMLYIFCGTGIGPPGSISCILFGAMHGGEANHGCRLLHLEIVS